MILETKSYRAEPAVTVFELSGRLCLGQACQRLEAELAALPAAGVRRLVIDLAGLQSIDSAGAGTLVMIAGKFADVGGEMKLAGAKGLVANVFSIIQMDKVARLYPAAAEACQSFA